MELPLVIKTVKDLLEATEELNGEYQEGWQEEIENGRILLGYLKQEPKMILTHEDQPISDFAQQVKELVTKEWGSHNLDAFVEAFLARKEYEKRNYKNSKRPRTR